MFDGIRNGIDRCSVSQSDTSLTEIGCSKNGFTNFMHTAFGKSADTKNLALVQLQRKVINLSLYAYILYRDYYFIRDLLTVIGTVIAIADFTAYHQLFQTVWCCFFFGNGSNINTVSQYADLVRLLDDLFQVMGNEDHTASHIAHLVHDLEKFFTAFLSKSSGSLVNNQHLRIKVSGFYNLDQLTVFKIIVINRLSRIDVVESITVQIFLSFFVHGCRILNTELRELILVAKENIFCYGQTRQGSNLLYDNCHTLMITIYLVCCRNFFAIQDKSSGIFLVNTGQAGSQCGLSRSVFSNQCMNLAFMKSNGDMIQSMCDSKMFINFFCF